MRKIFAILAAGISVLSCKEPIINDIILNVPDAVIEDFYSRYSIIAEITEAYTDQENISTISFTDRHGMKSTALYVGDLWSIMM